MPLYESTFIAKQELSRQDVTKLAEQMTGYIEAGGGKIVKNEYWGLRSLAYRIQKNRKGHYTHLGIEAPFEALKEMQRNMGIREEILRTFTVRVDELTAEPTAMMNMRSSYGEGEEIIRDSAPRTEVAEVKAETTDETTDSKDA